MARRFRLATLTACLACLVCSAGAVFALEEKNLNEPTVRPQAPVEQTAPAPAKPAAKGPKAEPGGAEQIPMPKDSGAKAGASQTKSAPAQTPTPAPAREPQPQPVEPLRPSEPLAGTGSEQGDIGQVFSMADREETFGKNEIEKEVNGFFEGSAQGLSRVVAKAFADLGSPIGYIKGQEAGGSLVVGFRYGEGVLRLKNGQTRKVYWQSPSLGFDLGANASKVFTLVYSLRNIDDIYRRFGGVDGSAYVIGGFGMNYQRNEGITLAPIRVGVGLRLGASVGYQHYTREQSVNPF